MSPLRMPNTRTGLLGVSALLSVPFTWFLMYYLVNGSAPDWFNNIMMSTGGAPLKSGRGMLAAVPPEMQPEWILLMAFMAVFAFMIATLLFWIMLLIYPGAHRPNARR